MLRKFVPCVIALGLAGPLFLAPAALAATPTVDELVAKNIEARGGASRLAAISSLRSTGRVLFGSGDGTVELQLGTLQKRGGLIRSELTLQGLTAVDAYDGKEAWSLNPFGGRRDAQRDSADDARERARNADLDGPLVGWREKGHRVEYLGTEDVEGTPAHKLRVRRKDGDTEYRYLDPDTWLDIRVVAESLVRGVEQVTETDLGAYHQIAGVWMPLSLESGAKGRPRSVRVVFDRVEANVEAPAELFAIPAPGTPLRRAVVAAKDAPAPGSSGPSGARGGGSTPVLDAGALSGLGARNIGAAAMSGRFSAVAAFNEGGRTTIYAGAASGGVWKSTDSGTTFKPVFDRMPVQSIGAITVDPGNHQTIWVGTGESWTRNSVSVGDGIYKSTDGGESFARMGLAGSERITRIIVHPTRSEVVYACVPGRLWNDSDERGLYKTSDGGKSWSKVLAGKNASTGCSSVTMDPGNPEVLLAGMWDFRRKGWSFRSGGDGETAPSGSGLFRSGDGGKSWSQLDAGTAKGLPEAPWGRVEVTFAPSDAKVVYALVEAKQSALYRSDDGGATWEARDRSQGMVWRPFYFARLVVDPRKADHLFKGGGGLIVSQDGGRSFSYTGGRAHGDWHDLWIDPDNTQHVIGGDDGGLWISHDGGSRWWKTDTLPVSQFYHVSVDDADPYRVYGGLQDNSSWIGESASPGGITSARWTPIPQGDGFWVVVDPLDPDWIYSESQGGYISRWNRKTGAMRDIQPKAGYGEKLRFNWNAPIVASPTDKGVLYLGAQFLFRTTDRGDTWQRLSPDLTGNDPDKQKQEQSGGITVDNSSAEMHTTIYSISESPRDARVLWVGTDDGKLQLSRDGGKSWSEVGRNVPDLPPASWVSWVEASRHDTGTAYATFDRHTFGDLDPWVYVTRDFGSSWRRIVSPKSGVRGWAHVIKEDVVRGSLLFLGTELGLWISSDSGATWAEWKGGDFPSVAVRDLAIQAREGDLVIGTHGRGIWIIDDLGPLRAITPDVLRRPAAFLPGRPAQQRMPAAGGWVNGDAAFVGDNPPGGAVITYYQRSRHLYGPLKLEILDERGKLVDTLPATRRRGINRVAWSMQSPPPRVPRAAGVAGSATRGPRLPPGVYIARLTKGADVVETRFTVDVDRRAPYAAPDRVANYESAMRAHALFGEMSALCDRLDVLKDAATARAAGLPGGDALTARLRAAADKVGGLKKRIVATKEGGAITGEERLREHLDLLYGVLLQWEGRPTRYQLERLDVLARELNDVAGDLEALAGADLRQLDEELKGRSLPTLSSATRPAPSRLPEAERALRCLREGGRECGGDEGTEVEAR